MLKDSEKFTSLIIKELDNVGLTFHKETTGYRSDSWKLNCNWKTEDNITIIWNKTFTENTLVDNDSNVEFVVNGDVLGTIDIEKLLNEKLDAPLNVHIAKSLKKIAGTYTGKLSIQ